MRQLSALLLCALVIACGKEGPTGPQGPPGEAGEQGERGLRGFAGSEGKSGTNDEALAEINSQIDVLRGRVDSLEVLLSEQGYPRGSPSEPEPVDVSELSGTIPDLASVQIGDPEGPMNWDGDIEDDGYQFFIIMVNSDSGLILWRATVAVEVRLYVSADEFDVEKEYETPYYKRTYVLTSWNEYARIAFDDLLPHIPESDVRRSAVIGPFVPTVIEVTVTVADGSTYSARHRDVLRLRTAGD